jgi:hypothetical protein
VDYQCRCKTTPYILEVAIVKVFGVTMHHFPHFQITLGTDPEGGSFLNIELMVEYCLSNGPDIVDTHSS